MKSRILFAVALGLLFVQISCMSNKSMMDAYETEPAFEEATAELKSESNYSGDRKPPLSIEAGISKEVLYANMPNPIKIVVEGGSTEHLVVTSNGGRIVVSDAKKGLYSFSDIRAGFVAEIIVKDTITGAKMVENFDLVEIPAPNAYVWKYRKMFKGQLIFNAETFKQQNAVILQHDQPIPARCAASSFTLVRIDSDGNRSSCVNYNKTGMFDEEAKKIIAAAKKGDLYIIKDISAVCSNLKVKNIVYEIQ